MTIRHLSPAVRKLGAVLCLATLAGCAADAMQSMGAPPMGSGMATPASVTVGGQPMLPGRDIVDNAVNSADHTTLVAAVKAAGLAETLKGPGPFTVFAPTNAAFNKLPPGTVNTLLQPANKPKLTAVLTYHVVPGRLDFMALSNRIREGGGRAMLTTVNGQMLTAAMNGPHNIVLTDANGGMAQITTYDVIQSNGVIQVIDTVLMPRG